MQWPALLPSCNLSIDGALSRVLVQKPSPGYSGAVMFFVRRAADGMTEKSSLWHITNTLQQAVRSKQASEIISRSELAAAVQTNWPGSPLCSPCVASLSLVLPFKGAQNMHMATLEGSFCNTASLCNHQMQHFRLSRKILVQGIPVLCTYVREHFQG